MYCAKCGQEIPDKSKKCPVCGEKQCFEPTEDDAGSILGLIAMILGFISVGTQMIGVNTAVALPAAVAGLVCGFMAKNKSLQAGLANNKAKTGIICSFVGIGVNIVMSILVWAFFVIYFAFFFGLMAIAAV